jgi:hypothetical protein
MEFDLIGHLAPYTVIPATFEAFEKLLVQSFPSNSTRYTIVEGYKRYLTRLKTLLNSNFHQWIDGSFVTDKMNPNDIDIVTFIDYNVFFQKERELSGLIAPESKLIYKVDAAFVPFYPINHRLHQVTEWDINFWKDFYSHTRPDNQNSKMQKGFIQLNF